MFNGKETIYRIVDTQLLFWFVKINIHTYTYYKCIDIDVAILAWQK